MENRLIPFSNFDDVKVGDKVVLHTWETTNNETKHHFYRDNLFAKIDGNSLNWLNCNIFPMEIVEKYGIVLETDWVT